MTPNAEYVGTGVVVGFSWAYCNRCEWVGPDRALRSQADADLVAHVLAHNDGSEV